MSCLEMNRNLKKQVHTCSRNTPKYTLPYPPSPIFLVSSKLNVASAISSKLYITGLSDSKPVRSVQIHFTLATLVRLIHLRHKLSLSHLPSFLYTCSARKKICGHSGFWKQLLDFPRRLFGLYFF